MSEVNNRRRSEREYDLVSRGADLGPGRAEKLEKRLQNDPSDLDSRLLLVGFYRRYVRGDEGDARREKLAEHLSWMIDNFPASKAISHVNIHKDGEAYRKVLKHWSRAVKRNPGDVGVLDNAGKFCKLFSPELSVRYYKQAQKIDPENDEWPRCISHTFYVNAHYPERKADCAAARNAIKYGRQALELHRQFLQPTYLETYMEMTVSELSNMSLKFGLLDDAEYFGNYLIGRPNDWRGRRMSKFVRRMLRFEVHMGHSILGRTAMARGDIQSAKSCLRKMPELGNPDWRFDLSLASELLEEGEGSAVVDYLEACAAQYVKKLEALEKDPAESREVPALLWMYRDNYDSEMDMDKYMKLAIKDKLKRLAKWSKAIAAGRKVKLDSFIGP